VIFIFQKSFILTVEFLIRLLNYYKYLLFFIVSKMSVLMKQLLLTTPNLSGGINS